MVKKAKVLVLMGGKSPEHEISLIGGMEIVRNIDPKKYEVLPGIISKDGKKLQLVTPDKLLNQKNPLEIRNTNKNLIQNPDKELSGVSEVGNLIDVVFIVMHGPFGEDGTVQGMLEISGLPYTGSGVLASALGMDKLMFRKILKTAGIKYPRFASAKKGESLENVKKQLGSPPYFVKPGNQGSSVGNSLVRNHNDLKKAMDLALQFSEVALVDEYVKGLELTCGILGNDNPIALPLIEIHPLKGEFFDYESKYTESGAEEIVPARISKSLTKKVQEIAICVYKELGCRGFSRVDFILKNDIEPYVLEINTIPGLTPMSLLPKAAKEYGLNYQDLLSKIIEYATEKN